MNKYINEILERLEKLYTIYERYAWKNENTKINIIIQDSTISFYLDDENKINDEFIIAFDEEEYVLYQYLSLEVLAIVLGNVYVHQKDNILYNNHHRPYVKMCINDEFVLKTMRPILNNQDKEFIHKNMDYLYIARLLLLKLTNKKYDNSFLINLDTRINIIKKVLTR